MKVQQEVSLRLLTEFSTFVLQVVLYFVPLLKFEEWADWTAISEKVRKDLYQQYNFISKYSSEVPSNPLGIN